MRLCPMKDLNVGMILGKSIYYANGKLLLSAGFRINTEVKEKLIVRGYTSVYIMEEGTDDIVPEDVISEELRLYARAKLDDKVEDIKKRGEFKTIACDKAKQYLESDSFKSVNISYDARRIVEEILGEISSVGSQFMNTVMVSSKDSYFLDHAINVTIFSILIGKQYRFSREELVSLALGAFLHDIGKVITSQVKNGETIKDADELYREHPTFGYLLLSKNFDITPIEKQIVNQHHENQDGTGFPIGLKGQNLPPLRTVVRESKGYIYRLAEICCVADAYENMVNNPNESNRTSPEQAVKDIILGAGIKFNSDVIQTLLKIVPFYPVGSTIKVIDIVDPHLVGCQGVVAKINENDINRPVIILTKDKFQKRMGPVVIDTSKFTRIELKLVI